MPALSFKKEFADAVRKQQKCQTIRATRKNPIKVGDTLYLYTGMRTKECEKIGEVVCKSVDEIEMTVIGVRISGQYLTSSEVYRLAIADGFRSPLDFLNFFKSSFKGQLIKW